LNASAKGLAAKLFAKGDACKGREGEATTDLGILHMGKWSIGVRRVRKISREQALLLNY